MPFKVLAGLLFLVFHIQVGTARILDTREPTPKFCHQLV